MLWVNKINILCVLFGINILYLGLKNQIVSIKQPQNTPSKQVKNKTAPEQLITTENAFSEPQKLLCILFIAHVNALYHSSSRLYLTSLLFNYNFNKSRH
ncbi:hypothetical protein DRW31_17715 [Shigella dysenteriae]|uniref:Uncharacterized protein n=2 Tax=Shigella TaxID=620 RepID=A0A1S9IVY1_SHIBO|nr:hypothetical protein [Shigella dysenteriae]EGE2519048.1 hypothetical protein [Shigella dysenteriae]MLU14111.1 hypothetical protein [Shigella dysenteriae]OOO74629.1 hypothetical protein AJR17_024770 [Shigella boydii]